MNDLDQIAEAADDLTEPHINRESYTIWDHNRHRQLRHHTTVQPGLLAQLYQSVMPVWSTAADPAGAIPASRPPLEVEALSRHDRITMAALTWCTDLGIQPRIAPESNIRALVGAAGSLDPDRQHALLADLRRWRSWCRVYLQLERIQVIRGIGCPLPDCQQRGTLRVNLTTATALCTACGAIWTDRDGSISILAEHIRTTPGHAA